MYKIFNIKESKCNFCNYKIKKCVINFTFITVVSILHLLQFILLDKGISSSHYANCKITIA